jgi:enamine deaminase RidA (YjgF/YER057c/UK114 family)
MRVAGFFVLFVVIVIGLPVAGAEERAGLADRLRQGFGESAVALAKAEARSEQNERRRVIAPPGPKPVGPYSPGILADDFLYVSGQGGRDAEGKLPATIEGQVRQTLQNVKVIVEAAGLTMERGWREFFPKAAPARSVLGVYRLPTDIAVEINAVAFRDRSRTRLIVPPGYPSNLSWTPGVMAGDRLYLSGALGSDVSSGRVPVDSDAQVQLAFDNMKRTLVAAGMDFHHVVFVNPYVTDQASRQMNAIYAKQFEFGNTPARATIRVTSLPGGNAIALTGVAVADLSKRLAVRPKNMSPSATASPCVFAGDTYYCSAKGPFTPGPALSTVEGPRTLQGIWVGTVEAQVRQTMRNLLDGLEEAGLKLSNVVATNVYLDDMDDFPRMNKIYATYFPEVPPTRTTVAQLAPTDRTARNGDTYPALEQISLIAVK